MGNFIKSFTKVQKNKISLFAHQHVQGCKIPLARLHLRVKCYAGRIKVLTICVVHYSNLQHLGKIGDMKGE